MQEYFALLPCIRFVVKKSGVRVKNHRACAGRKYTFFGRNLPHSRPGNAHCHTLRKIAQIRVMECPDETNQQRCTYIDNVEVNVTPATSAAGLVPSGRARWDPRRSRGVLWNSL